LEDEHRSSFGGPDCIVYIPDGTYNSYQNAHVWGSFNLIDRAANSISGSCGASGSNLAWELTNDGVLTISGSGKMADYGYKENDRSPWYPKRTNIKKLVIGNSVTSIGQGAFYECKSLTSITIPNSVTSIGGSAFGGCSNLVTKNK